MAIVLKKRRNIKWDGVVWEEIFHPTSDDLISVTGSEKKLSERLLDFATVQPIDYVSLQQLYNNPSSADPNVIYVCTDNYTPPAGLKVCYGHFQDKSLPSGNSVITPIADNGNLSLISGNNFLVPEDGLWELYMGGGRLPSATTVASIFIMSASGKYAQSISPNFVFCTATFQDYLHAGDSLTCNLNVTVAATTFESTGTTMWFVYRRLL